MLWLEVWGDEQQDSLGFEGVSGWSRDVWPPGVLHTRTGPIQLWRRLRAVLWFGALLWLCAAAGIRVRAAATDVCPDVRPAAGLSFPRVRRTCSVRKRLRGAPSGGDERAGDGHSGASWRAGDGSSGAD